MIFGFKTCGNFCTRELQCHSTARKTRASIISFSKRSLTKSSRLTLSLVQAPFRKQLAVKLPGLPWPGLLETDFIGGAYFLPFHHVLRRLKCKEPSRSCKQLHSLDEHGLSLRTRADRQAPLYWQVGLGSVQHVLQCYIMNKSRVTMYIVMENHEHRYALQSEPTQFLPVMQFVHLLQQSAKPKT